MPFEPVGLGLEIFQDRYTRHQGETWQEACRRVANHVAQAEQNGAMLKYTERFYEELVENRFMPGGRIWYGSGRPKAQLLNCFVIPTGDSREGWGKTFYDVTVISGLGGGVGINCSPIRPRGSEIRGTGGQATGSVSLMHAINAIGEVIRAGGGRRTALMLCLEVNHPDLEEFLDVKLEKELLNNANISVVLNLDTEQFAKLVLEDGEIPLEFNGRPTGQTVKALDLWRRIVKNAWQSGEPGVLNGYLANKQSNIWYHKPLVSTNPCGEIWLEEYGCCDLGALVLPRFISGGTLDWDQLDSTIRAGVRFLDDVLSINHYPIPEIRDNCESLRRLGLGVMGLHSMLLELGMRYSSVEARQFIDKLFSFIKNTAYDASINLAIEKGPFPAYDNRFLDSGFAKTLKRGIRNKIKEHGIRNCALLTIAPTGTTGMVAGVSTGIEPLFAPVYYRHYFKPTEDGVGTRARELVVTPEFEKFGDIAEGAYDLSPREHFEIQKIVQKHIDNAVSKTINLPKEFAIADLANVWLEYLPYLKGTTFYREGSREFEPLEPVRHKDIKKAVKEDQKRRQEMYGAYADVSGVEIHTNWSDQNAMDCPDGVCEVPWAQEVQQTTV